MMSEKLKSAIEKIALDATVIDGEDYAATFHNVEMEPTFVNFLYGNNGTGKSTIATAIFDRFGLSWQQGKTESDYSILVYNHKFVVDNFSDPNSFLRGIYTMGAKNVEIQKEVAEKQEQEGTIRKKIALDNTAKGEAEAEANGLIAKFQESFCKAGNAVRRTFPDALKGKVRQNDVFARFVFELAEEPIEHDMDELKALYGVAYDANAQKYGEFRSLNLSQLKSKTECDLLMRAIISTSNSTFAATIKKLGDGGFDWVIRGHEHYEPNADGNCPYCQRPLEKKFAELLQACFDKQYQDEIAALRNFRVEYERYVRSFIESLNANLLQTVYPKLVELPAYTDKIAALETILKLNIQLIDGKLKEPSLPMADNLADIESLCVELNTLIDGFNRLIKDNNAIFADKENKKKECGRQVLSRLAFDVQEIKKQYNADLAALKAKISELTARINADTVSANGLRTERTALNKQIVNIEDSVNGINNLLRDSGFEGFRLKLREDGSRNEYQVIRTRTGKVAKNLSEGERNFIAFLYFYHLVNKGSHSDVETGKDRIVVLDDPVSSMDSSVLFIVSALVRELIEVCYNNVKLSDESGNAPNYVKQLFVLTHNMYFHNEITHGQVERYEGVSFFLVNKANEHSTISLCDDWSGAGSKVNVNPVKNAYVALWSGYKDLLKPRKDESTSYHATLLNNSNQILEYYFIQLCGYTRDSVRKAVNEMWSAPAVGNGVNMLNPKRLLALAMLDNINSESRNAPDSAFYSGGVVDAEQYKEAFESIFGAMNHRQHYEKMMA
jgi:wobble nucleotide-excising tRNase